MKFRYLFLSGALLLVMHSSAIAQMVPGGGPMTPTSNNGTVISSPANAVAYFAATGNKVVGGTVLTFNPGTSLLTVPNISTAALTASTSISSPLYLQTGSSSGTISFRTQANSGTYNWNWPTTAGTIGQLLMSNGGNSNVMTWSTPTGNASNYTTFAGTAIAGSCLQFDSSMNATATGSPCSTSSGSVNPGTINQVAWYNATGSTVSGLPTLASGILNTNGSGVPSITASPTISGTFTAGGFSGPLNGTVGATTPAAGTFTTANVTTNLTAPFIYGGSVGSSALNLESTSGTGTTDFIAFTTGNTQQLLLNHAGQLTATNQIISPSYVQTGSSSGQIVFHTQANAGTYNWYWPTTVGTAGQPLLSDGGAGTGQTWGSLSGAGSFFTMASAASLNGCATWTSGVMGTTGSSCSTSSGSVNAGTINQMAWYAANGSTVSGLATANNSILATNGSGVPSITGTLPFTLPATTGGTGNTTNTLNGVLYGNGTSAILATTQGAANTILTANAGAPVFSASPTIGTSVTTPLLIGGTAVSSSLTLESTSGAGTTDSIIMKVASQKTRLLINDAGNTILGGDDNTTVQSNATLRASNLSGISDSAGSSLTIASGVGTGLGGSGQLLFQTAPPGVTGGTPNTLQTVMNIGSTLGVKIGNGNLATAQLELAAGTSAANTSPLKFVSGTNLTTPESGAVEFNGTDLFLTTSAIRKTIQVGTMALISAASIPTGGLNVGALRMISGESYIVDVNLQLTSSTSTAIISFSAGGTSATTLGITCQLAASQTTLQLISNSASTATCPATALGVRINGLITATSTATFNITAASNTATIPLLNGSYYSFTHL